MHSQGKAAMGLAQVGGAVEVREPPAGCSGPLIGVSMRVSDSTGNVPSSAQMLHRQL